MHKDHILNELGPSEATPEWHAVKIDESDGCGAEFLKRCGGKCYQIYLIDMSTRTHLCEFTPSYCMIPVELVAETYPEDDGVREDLYEELRTVFYECCNDVSYMHCHDIEQLPAEDKHDLEIKFPSPEDWSGDDRGAEAVLEYYQGNPIW